MGYQVIARKWRPQSFADVVGQQHVTRTLENAIRSGRVAHAYIFSGARGVGKTTTARILAKALNCVNGPTAEPCNVCDACIEVTAGNSMDVLEIDAASNRGIDQVRELREMVRYVPAGGRYKVVILDEAHMLTSEASNALLKTLEEPPEKVVFVMATTEPENLQETIRSRSQHFHFRALSFAEIVDALREIANKEELNIEEAALAVMARAADGSLRDGMSLLEQARAYCGDTISAAQVREFLGVVPAEILDELVAAIEARSASRALGLVHRLLSEGQNLQQFCREAVAHFRNLLVARVCGEDSDLVAAPAEERPRLARGANLFSEEDLTRFFQILLGAEDDVRRKPDPRLHLEMALLRMVNSSRLAPLEEVLAELSGQAAPREGRQGSGGAGTAFNTAYGRASSAGPGSGSAYARTAQPGSGVSTLGTAGAKTPGSLTPGAVTSVPAKPEQERVRSSGKVSLPDVFAASSAVDSGRIATGIAGENSPDVPAAAAHEPRASVAAGSVPGRDATSDVSSAVTSNLTAAKTAATPRGVTPSATPSVTPASGAGSPAGTSTATPVVTAAANGAANGTATLVANPRPEFIAVAESAAEPVALAATEPATVPDARAKNGAAVNGAVTAARTAATTNAEKILQGPVAGSMPSMIARAADPASGLDAAQVSAIKLAVLSQQKFLGELVEHAHRWELDAGEIRLYFPTESRALAELLQGRESMEKLRTISSRVLGQQLRVCVKLEAGPVLSSTVRAAQSAQELRARFEQDPIVRAMLERFGGRISEVKRRDEE